MHRPVPYCSARSLAVNHTQYRQLVILSQCLTKTFVVGRGKNGRLVRHGEPKAPNPSDPRPSAEIRAAASPWPFPPSSSHAEHGLHVEDLSPIPSWRRMSSSDQERMGQRSREIVEHADPKVGYWRKRRRG